MANAVRIYTQIRQPARCSFRHDEVEILLTVVYVHISNDISESFLQPRCRVPVPPPPLAITVFCTGVHGVSAGETCGSVARDARLTLPQFMDLNQNITCGALFPGQWVCVRGAAIG